MVTEKMNTQLQAILPTALGDDPTHVVTLKDAQMARDASARPAYLYLNAVAALHIRDHSSDVRITVRGDEMTDADQAVMAAALAVGKDISIKFIKGLAYGYDFLGDLFDSAACEAVRS